jgi:hypothetical protein
MSDRRRRAPREVVGPSGVVSTTTDRGAPVDALAVAGRGQAASTKETGRRVHRLPVSVLIALQQKVISHFRCSVVAALG